MLQMPVQMDVDTDFIHTNHATAFNQERLIPDVEMTNPSSTPKNAATAMMSEVLSNFSSNNKTKKIRKSQITKQIMWNKFDENIGINDAKEISPSPSASLATPLQCVFRTSGERELCDHCQTVLVLTDEGFLGCPKPSCGIIYTDSLDQGAEWRFYGADDNHSGDPTRCGMPVNPLLQESSYSCKVVSSCKSSYEMRKIRRYNEWQSMPYKEKARYEDFQRITTLADQGGIPKIIIDDAMRYHKKISDAHNTFRGDNRDGVIAATIYIAAKINNYPRTAKEIASIFHLDNTSATKGCKIAMSILNDLEHEMRNEEKTILCSTTPLSFIDRYCSRLNINAELTKLCQFVALRIQSGNLIPENTPHSIAAGIVYFVSQQCNINVSKRAVNAVSEISEVTINKCFKKLETLKDKLIPQCIRDKYNS